MKKLLGEEQNRQIAAQHDQIIHFFFSYRGCRHGSMKTHMFRSSGCSAAEILKNFCKTPVESNRDNEQCRRYSIALFYGRTLQGYPSG